MVFLTLAALICLIANFTMGLYINDSVTSSELFKCIMFTDDMNLFLSNVSLDLLVSNINIELAKVSRLLKLNKLSLNIKKL